MKCAAKSVKYVYINAQHLESAQLLCCINETAPNLYNSNSSNSNNNKNQMIMVQQCDRVKYTDYMLEPRTSLGYQMQ